MNTLPSGDVAFLFTDIEGSTRLVRQLRGRWPEVWAEHQRLLREAFAAHVGYSPPEHREAMQAAQRAAPDSCTPAFCTLRTTTCE